MICWPGGQSLPEGSENCRRRLSTWLLEGSEPPTLLLPEQEGIRGIRFPVWLDKTGKRVAADCPDATEKVLDVWPRKKGLRVFLPDQLTVRLWTITMWRRL